MKKSHKVEWLEESFELLKANGHIRAGQMFMLRTAMNRPLWCAARIRAAAGRTAGARVLEFLRLRVQWEAAYVLDTYFYSFFELFPGYCFNFPNTRIAGLLEQTFASQPARGGQISAGERGQEPCINGKKRPAKI